MAHALRRTTFDHGPQTPIHTWCRCTPARLKTSLTRRCAIFFALSGVCTARLPAESFLLFTIYINFDNFSFFTFAPSSFIMKYFTFVTSLQIDGKLRVSPQYDKKATRRSQQINTFYAIKAEQSIERE